MDNPLSLPAARWVVNDHLCPLLALKRRDGNPTPPVASVLASAVVEATRDILGNRQNENAPNKHVCVQKTHSH